jgi:lysophospholipase L1-like esterase
MANIQQELNKIKTSLYGRDIRKSIHDGIEKMNDETENISSAQSQLETTFEQLIINAGNSNAEVVAARTTANNTTYPQLKNRLDSYDAQLKEKASRDSIWNMSNIGQDVKEAMTGGSVAVTGVNSVLQENIVNGQIVPMKTSFIELGKNLLDESTLQTGYLHSNGSLKSGNYKTTTYIQFDNNSVINLSRMDQPEQNKLMTKRPIRIACFYDSNYNLISDYYYNNTSNLAESITYNGSSNVSYIRVSIGNGFVDGKSMLYLGNELTEFEDVSYKVKNLRLNQSLKKDIELLIDNKLKNKTIIGFGDSIMRGAGNGNIGIVDLIAEKNNMTCINKAVSGATILTDTDNNIPMQIKNCTDLADYVVIDGYINDCLISDIENRLGTVSQYFGSSFDTTSFAGQLESMLRDVQNKFIGSKILYVFVHTMSSRDNEIVKKVHGIAKECCKKWSICYVDLYEEGILNTMISGHRMYTNNSDGTHPTEEGYKLYYIPQIEAKLKTL